MGKRSAQIRAINHQVLYMHRMKILRLEKVQQEDLSVKTDWIVKAEAIPCKLSKDSLDRGNKIKEDVNPIAEQFTVFCDPEVEIQAGDLLEIHGVRYRAGNPFYYPTHQEIKAARETLA